MDWNGTSAKTLQFNRSYFFWSDDGLNTREIVSSVSHYLDASQVILGLLS
jgi:hypothetical protein